MRRAISILIVLAAALSMPAAPAEQVGECDLDGRVGGRPTGRCFLDLEGGVAYSLVVEPRGREASGEIQITITEDDGDGRIDIVCYVAATVAAPCTVEGNRPADTDPTALEPNLTFSLENDGTLAFRVSPPFCGTVTCGRDPQVSVGRFRLTLSTAG